MKLGIFYASAGPWATPDGARALGETAEAMGFDSVFAVDHAVLPVDFAPRYATEGGAWSVPDDYPIADPMVWLGFVAACTTTLRLGTGVLIATLRNPVQLAKQAATLDVLSRGRLVLGLGAGWIEEELAAAGVPLDERMARLEESVAAMRVLWREPVAKFDGRFTSFRDVVLSPKPVAGDIPVVLGGRTPAAARRAGRLGDGFFPHQRDPDELERLFGIARQAAEDAGRDPGALELIAGGARSSADVERLASMGVSQVIFSPRAGTVEELPDALDAHRRRLLTG